MINWTLITGRFKRRPRNTGATVFCYSKSRRCVITYLLTKLLKFVCDTFFMINRWLTFEKVIDCLVAESFRHINVRRLQTIAEKVCFITDEDEFHTVLNFYHDLGLIVKHRDTVFLDARWLIDLFRQLITIPRFDKAVRICDVR